MNAAAPLSDPAPVGPRADAPELRLQPMTAALLDQVLAIEQNATAHPWSRRHFSDTLAAGHHAMCLLGGEQLLGYCVAMLGVDEAHLLNIAMAPAFQGQGLAALLLDALALWARGQGAQQLWLEVRVGNARAIAVYQRAGYETVSRRRAYYPAGPGEREDALVMRQRLVTP